MEDFDNISINNLTLDFPAPFVFDLPHARALNIFFALTLINNKTNTEIGSLK